ncbi:DUF4973 domain-containing protein [Arachidicoccus ginsenosidivorans]|uniref:DUF4973 domain-containing protein n=1 Tax=Arachidicoccus ginsenosidivorans TaxID=496057 RepID=A0A5B8VS73_9BACT|nr:DUF4973 domain-containing protein [Arachidicoccus ginsenosidivorans]QEC73138.1 DUF4973 domain-containing protein [Arachidicoccus ginsenosidivorans]
MKKIAALITILLCIGSMACNKEWTDEQFKQYVSFKAPLNGDGVTPIHVRYKPDGMVDYQLPVIVSGTTDNKKNLMVHLGVDPDTLKVFNDANFQNRTDLYYKELTDQYFKIPDTVSIPKGSNTNTINIGFTLSNIDLVDKWILPLTIEPSTSNEYTPNPRRNFSKALLRIVPFNDFSGDYSGTALKVYLKGEEDGAAIVKSIITTYVVDDNTIFFYAGTVDENKSDRRNYKIIAHFDTEKREVTLTSDNPLMNLQVNKTINYSVEEIPDELQPYLVHRYVTISNIDYNYTDYTSVAGASVDYTIRGSLIMERKINTQIPDEDQAIQW